MKIAFLECTAGVSGDMFLAALLDAGLDENDLRRALGNAGIENDEIVIGQTVKKGIASRTLTVIPRESRPHLHVADIRRIFRESNLPETVRSHALETFERIIRAEAAIHGVPEEKVHLHEVSGLDTIVDILGVAYGLHAMEIDTIYSTELHAGSGTVKISHGVVPVPAPATGRILQGIPMVIGSLPGERVTPTGAALIKTFVDHFETPPPFTLLAAGYGAGLRDDGDRANVLRILIGETESADETTETLFMAETNIDDQSPEQLTHVQSRLMDQPGILDVHLIPVMMKKGRSGFLLRVLCRPESLAATQSIIVSETTSLGVRHFPVNRVAQPRSIETVETPYGEIEVTRSGHTLAPEFEQCRKAAATYGVPLRVVYHAAVSAATPPDPA